MLIGLNPLLSPDLLRTLRAMGHVDAIVLADANFPVASVVRRLIRADGSDLPSLLPAVLSVLPIDEMEPEPAIGMDMVGDATPAELGGGLDGSEDNILGNGHDLRPKSL